MSERADVGMLFVHGIGSQASGSTLDSFGRPFLEYATSRLERAGGSLDVVASGGGDTWTAAVRVDSESRRWRLREAWWAESFPTPGHAGLAAWAAFYAPWLIQRDALRYPWRGGAGFGRLALVAMLSAAGNGG